MISKCLILRENALSACFWRGLFSKTTAKKGSSVLVICSLVTEVDLRRPKSFRLYTVSSNEELWQKKRENGLMKHNRYSTWSYVETPFFLTPISWGYIVSLLPSNSWRSPNEAATLMDSRYWVTSEDTLLKTSESNSRSVFFLTSCFNVNEPRPRFVFKENLMV